MGMSSPDLSQTLEGLLALEPEEVLPTLQMASPLPRLEERVDLFLQEIHGRDQEFTRIDRECARDRILNKMASEVIAGISNFQTDNSLQDNSALFMPLFALLVDGVPLREEAQKFWRADPQVRNDFEHLKLELQAKNCGLGFPAVAAAASSSDDALDDRKFEGGSIRIRRSSHQGQVFIVLRFEANSAVANPPSALLLEGPEGEVVRLELPKPDADGQIILIKNLKDYQDSLLVQLLRRPQTVGTFLK
jgi:hypothetical protein